MPDEPELPDDVPAAVVGSQRLEAFSDGVFAIAATLLVLDVRVPEGDAGEPLLHRLVAIWPSYLAYAVSFLVIGIMWLNHHGTFVRVARVDRRLLTANLVLLGLVAFIPFPTSVLAAHVTGGGPDARTAAVLYSLVLAATALAFAAIWAHLRRQPDLLAEHAEPHAPTVALRRALLGVGLYLLTVPLDLVAPVVALVVFGLIAVAYLFAEQLAREEGGRLPV